MQWAYERGLTKATVHNDPERMKENSKNIHIETVENNITPPVHPIGPFPWNTMVPHVQNMGYTGVIIGAPINIINMNSTVNNYTMVYPINSYNHSTMNCMNDRDNVISDGDDNFNSNGEMIYKPPSPNPSNKTNINERKPTKPPITHKAYLVDALTKDNSNDNKNDDSTTIMTNINEYNNLHEISKSNNWMVIKHMHDDEHVHDTFGGAPSVSSRGGRSRRRGRRKSIQNKIKQGTANVGLSVAVENDIITMKPKRRRRKRGRRGKCKGKAGNMKNDDIIMNTNTCNTYDKNLREKRKKTK